MSRASATQILGPAVPTLPVRSVRIAQAQYRDRLGFEIAWHLESDGIGAVHHGECALFLRETDDRIAPLEIWIFAPDLQRLYEDLVARDAALLGPPRDRPWGLRQFAARDGDGHLLTFHHDLSPAGSD